VANVARNVSPAGGCVVDVDVDGAVVEVVEVGDVVVDVLDDGGEVVVVDTTDEDVLGSVVVVELDVVGVVLGDVVVLVGASDVDVDVDGGASSGSVPAHSTVRPVRVQSSVNSTGGLSSWATTTPVMSKVAAVARSARRYFTMKPPVDAHQPRARKGTRGWCRRAPPKKCGRLDRPGVALPQHPRAALFRVPVYQRSETAETQAVRRAFSP
jgi:hypothetical protein